MARRRMRRQQQQTTPEPTPPEAPAPVDVVTETPPQTTAVAAPEAADATGLALSPALQKMFAAPYKPPENVDTEDGPGLSYVGFYSGRESAVRGAAIIGDLGEVPAGTPYAHVDGSYYQIGAYRYMMLSCYAYHATHDSGYKPTAAWLESPGKQAVVNGAQAWVKECILSLGLLVPGQSDLPDDLRPAVITIDTFRGAQTRGPKDLIKAQVASTTPAWAQRGANAAVAGAVPRPEFRVSAAIQGVSQMNIEGTDKYIICNMFPDVVGPAQIQAVGAWAQDADLQQEAAEYLEEFERRKAAIQALLAK